ncbi:MAG: electron transfer flavoprotein subunit beta/FixA family protein [Smithellaceae bacterium]
MDIVVCIKPVLDPDLPLAKFKVDENKKEAVPPEGMPLVLNPYDVLAVEAALRIKEASKGKVTVLTVGDKSFEGVVRKALAMGADECILLSDPAFQGSDSFATAHILTKAVERIGKYDLVLCGRQASDWDNGVVGAAIAEYLGVPCIPRAKEIQIQEGKVNVVRSTVNGQETYEAAIPAVITLSSEFGQARIPTGRGIIFAAKKQIPVWDAQTLGTDAIRVGQVSRKNSILRLYIPSYVRTCEMFDGDDKAAAAAALAQKIISMRRV